MDRVLKIAIAGYGRSGCDIHSGYLASDPRFRVRVVTLDQVRRQVYVLEEAHKQNKLPVLELPEQD